MGEHCEPKTRTVPALFMPEAELAPVPVAFEVPVVLEVLDTPALLLVAPAAALGEAAAPTLLVLLAPVAPPVPPLKLTVPTASWTLSGGAGTVGAPKELVVDVEDVPLAPTLDEAPAAPLGATLAAVPVELVPEVPVEVLPDVPDELALPLAIHAGLLAALVPVVAPGAVELVLMPEEPADDTGRALTELLAPTAPLAPAAVDVTGRVLAPVLGPVAGLVLPPTLELALLPHAANMSAAAASVGTRGFEIIESSALARRWRTR